ncbi:MAG: hypothetical protein FWG84_07895 [Bacteroidales bacterium]|nr:hypothetical protein [Bacteroidales bacterium]
MNTILGNIKNGNVFSKEGRSDHELLKGVYDSIDNLNDYNFSISISSYRGAIAFYFRKALGHYGQTHQLSQ